MQKIKNAKTTLSAEGSRMVILHQKINRFCASLKQTTVHLLFTSHSRQFQLKATIVENGHAPPIRKGSVIIQSFNFNTFD